jgi:hypothetical protein
MEERARNKGKRMSISDEELEKSYREFGIRSPFSFTPTLAPIRKKDSHFII